MLAYVILFFILILRFVSYGEELREKSPHLVILEIGEYYPNNTYVRRGISKFLYINNNSVVIPHNWALALNCSANYPILWKTNGYQGKRNMKIIQSKRSVDVSDYNDPRKYQFSRKLWYPVETGNTGPVQCVSIENSSLSTEIYVFVLDPDSRTSFFNSNAHLTKLNPNIIPCALFDPYEQVSLWKNGNEALNAVYNPRVGFTLENDHSDHNTPDHFECRSLKDNFTFVRNDDTVLKCEPENSTISTFENEDITLLCSCNKNVKMILPNKDQDLNISTIIQTDNTVHSRVRGKLGNYEFECHCGNQSKMWDLLIIASVNIFVQSSDEDIRCSSNNLNDAKLTSMDCRYKNTCELNKNCLENGKCKSYSKGALTSAGTAISLIRSPNSGFVQCSMKGAKTTKEMFTGLDRKIYFSISSAEEVSAVARMDEVQNILYSDEGAFFVHELVHFLFAERTTLILLTYKNGTTKYLVKDHDYTRIYNKYIYQKYNRPGISYMAININLTAEAKELAFWAPLEDSFNWHKITRKLNVIDPLKPNIQNRDMEISFTRGQKGQLTCIVEGKPTPNVTWLSTENISESSLTTALKDGIVHHTITFNSNSVEELENQVDYICQASNRIGNDTRKFIVKFEDPRSLTKEQLYGTILGSGAAFLILLAVMFILWRKYNVTKKLLRDLTDEELEQFIKGSPELAKNFVNIHEKVEYMPYDNKYEIPIKDLKFDMNDVLGSGAFGIVLKGSYKQIPVAVKMTRSNADISYFKALLSELKIMIYIGKHDNVVNFLGSFTENIKNRVLYIIVELCPGGDLLMRLKNYKKELQNLEQPAANHQNEYANSLINEEARIVKLITAWPRQIADGMDYLANKKVIHGDLAARNILLTAEDIAKITDFGLSRQLYQYSIYAKKSQSPLPWRWMAPESLAELIFSSDSDMWSFGVTLWEIYSLGDLPYPSLAWTPEFTEMILKGIRMKKPKYVSDQIYEVICKCLSVLPDKRPTFADVSTMFQKIAAKQ